MYLCWLIIAPQQSIPIIICMQYLDHYYQYHQNFPITINYQIIKITVQVSGSSLVLMRKYKNNLTSGSSTVFWCCGYWEVIAWAWSQLWSGFISLAESCSSASIQILLATNLSLKAHLYEHGIANETSNDDRRRDVRPDRCSKRQD